MKIVNQKVCGMKHPIGLGSRISFGWIIEADGHNLFQQSYQLTVRETDSGVILWDSGIIESQESVSVLYEGPALSGQTPYEWKVVVTVTDGEQAESGWAPFELALLPGQRKAGWVESSLPTVEKKKASASLGTIKEEDFWTGEDRKAPTYFRRDFGCEDAVAKARLSVTSHGVYEAYLNGIRVDDRVLAPEYTSYYEHLLFQTYDVTSLLTQGDNAVGVIVADGWWSGTVSGGENSIYGLKHGLWLQLDITYQNGTQFCICSDELFRCSAGPILFSDIFIGESYDAAKEFDGWSCSGFDDSSWNMVSVGTEAECTLCPQENPPVRVIEQFAPKELFKAPNGDMILDVGANITGFLTLKLKAPRGTTITLRHTEVLDKEGNYFHNLRFVNNLQQITYKCKGEMNNGELVEESYTPHFCWQGFRYVKITCNVPVSIEQFLVNVISSDNELTGTFACSNEKVNRLQENIVRSQRGNLISIPTDCPQRERAGWTGDAEVFCPTATFNQSMSNFMKKWMTDLGIDQKENGAIPQVVPRDPHKYPTMMGADAMAGWSDACVMIPYTIYRKYGDKDILQDNYETMEKWIAYVTEKSKKNPFSLKFNKNYRKHKELRQLSSHLWNTGFQYGDWLIPSLTTGNVLSIFKGAHVTGPLFASAYYAKITEMMAEIAEVLNRKSDVQKYQTLHENIKKAFRLLYINEDGTITPDLQGCYVIALQFGLVPESLKEKCVSRLRKKIAENGGCQDTGFLSVPYLLDALSSNGYVKDAYDLLFQEKCPSWMYEINQGATTIWESWGAIEDGQPKACSYNHYAFGSVGAWMYGNIGGLSEIQSGYKRFLVFPKMDDRIGAAHTRYESVYGVIEIDWKREGKIFSIDVTVPVNTSCQVVLPDGSTKECGSGKYSFRCEI